MSNQMNKRGQKRSYAQAFPNGNGNGSPSKRRRVNGRRNGNRGGKGAQKQAFAAAAYASGQRTGQAQIYRNGVDSTRIVHRELIDSVTGTVAFTVARSFPLNPGMAASFPWLSNEAQGWEKYRWNKLRYCYYTRTGSNIPGSVMLAPDYDASDPAPGSEVAASSYEDAEEDAPWKDIVCELKQSELMGDMKERYLRFGALAANQDIKMYDSGNLHLCTVDGTAVAWGKLWVEYDVTLFTPQVPSGGFQAAGTLQSGGGTIAAATPFGAVPVPSGVLVLTNTGANDTVTVGNVQIGQEICVSAAVVGTVITATSLGTLVGLTSKGSVTNCINAAQLNAAQFYTFIVTAVNPSFQFDVTATTVTSTSLVVSVLAPIPSF